MAAVTDDQREAHLRDLAERMQFRMEKSGEHFILTRTADLSRPARATDLTLDEVQEVLDIWKLRGLSGG